MSFFKDRRAIDCVVRMVTAEQPDLVAVTGDIAYPVPFQSGTFNNKTGRSSVWPGDAEPGRVLGAGAG